MSTDDHDDLAREVEAGLARLATRAVPDDATVPAPPWHDRRRRVDPRRFGRATPWLVAAVLLVLAGLGVGAGVAFDASGPDRGPVGTTGPSPTATSSDDDDDGTLGTPAATPTSTPSLDRGTGSTAPEDDTTSAPVVADFVVGVGSYGPLRVGMTEAEVVAALGGGSFTETYGPCRGLLLDAPPGANGTPTVIVLDGAVIGFIPAGGATDADGNGHGSTLAQVRASHPGGTLEQSAAGWVYTVVAGGNGLGFSFDTADAPSDTATVATVLVGTADQARGYELCAG